MKDCGSPYHADGVVGVEGCEMRRDTSILDGVATADAKEEGK